MENGVILKVDMIFTANQIEGIAKATKEMEPHIQPDTEIFLGRIGDGMRTLCINAENKTGSLVGRYIDERGRVFKTRKEMERTYV